MKNSKFWLTHCLWQFSPVKGIKWIFLFKYNSTVCTMISLYVQLWNTGNYKGFLFNTLTSSLFGTAKLYIPGNLFNIACKPNFICRWEIFACFALSSQIFLAMNHNTWWLGFYINMDVDNLFSVTGYSQLIAK